MNIDRDLLAAYLRQRADFGERDLLLETLERRDALGLLRGSGRLDTAAEEAPSGSLPALAEQAGGCAACGLAAGRTHVVFGDGPADAEVMVVGEAPGAEEDRTGIPFVGRAGHMLDLLLASVGLPRERVYICNVIKCRPPQNRDPAPEEVAACAGWLRGQLGAIRPRVLLAVGRFAARSLTGSDAPMGRLRGRVHEHDGVPVVATYHPAYLLRSPERVRDCWEDLQLLRRTLDEAPAREGAHPSPR